MSGSGGFGGGPFGGAPWGGSLVPLPPGGFVGPIYPLPTGIILCHVPIERFTGEPTTGPLKGSNGLLFFSPSLLGQIPGNQFDLDSIRIDTDATDHYSPPIIENNRIFLFGSTSTSRTNDPKFRTQPGNYTVVGALVDTALLILLANDLRTQYEAHRVSAVFHIVADAVNAITAPVAVDIPTSVALINDIKAKYNAHRTEAGVHAVNDTSNTVISPDSGGDGLSVAILGNEEKMRYNLHRTQVGIHLVNDGVNIVTAVDPSVLIKLI